MLNKALENYINTLSGESEQISDERKTTLQGIARIVSEKINNDETALLTFICTHNSRRSLMGQIWAQTAAYYFSIPHVRSFSGGTEATAFNPLAVEAMKSTGFDITIQKAGDNPLYKVVFADDSEPLITFSKEYDHDKNPKEDFCAIMTCSEADHNCPFIPGASHRFPVTYDDPKEFDDTPDEKRAYTERVRQIAREMFYLFSHVKK